MQPGREWPTIRRATPEDVTPLARALAAALDRDPWLAWIVPAERHRTRITALQEGLLGGIGVPHGEVWLAAGPQGDLLGGALWLLADRPVPPEAWAQVAATEGALLGERAPAAQAAAATTRHLRPTTPHHLLATLGVTAPSRRQGIGSALLAPMLERADRDGAAAYAETSDEANLAFYARLGFTVSDRADIPDGGPPVWALLRPPGGSSGS